MSNRTLLGVCLLLSVFASCASENSDDPKTTPQSLVAPAVTTTVQIEGTRPGNHTFDVFSDRASATILSLGNVTVNDDGSAVITPTPTWTPDGQKTSRDWRFQLSAPYIGRQDALEQRPSRSLHLDQHSMVADFDTWTVEYTHRFDGLEQVVHVNEKPDGESNLIVTFDAQDEFQMMHDAFGNVEVHHNAELAFVWSKLSVWDANGTPLVARMYPRDGRLTYEIEDQTAAYPITIDPLANVPDFAVLGTASGELGNVATAGDVNNDGFDDVLVGEYRHTNALTRQGRAFVFPGTASGLSSTAIWTVEGDAIVANFGTRFEPLGDLNGDGFDDFAVGSRNAGAGFVGGVYVFLGGNPPSTTAAFTAFGEEAGESFGDSITSGDFDCDGITDLAVSGVNWDPVPSSQNHGRVVVFPGLAVAPFFDDANTTDIERADLGSFWGRSITTGNVNNDSVGANDCDDLIVGGTHYSVGPARRGRVDVFLGSATGIDPNTIDWTVLGDVADRRLGFSIDSGVDVNGDNFDDVLISGYGAQIQDGVVHIYLGSATVPSLTPDWTVSIGQSGASFGFSVAFAGDVDNNGFEDVIIGAHQYVFANNEKVGAVFLYASAGALPPLTPTWTETENNQVAQRFGDRVSPAGDVNNDGFDDVIVGATLFDNGALVDAGAAYAYYGIPSCTIGGDVYMDGDPNPNNPCEACNTSVSLVAFTAVGNGGICDDGSVCTQNDTCNQGICSGTPIVCNDNESCTVDSCDPVLGCQFDGAPNDGNNCTDDGLTCTNDICAGGSCTHPIAADQCLITGTCYQDGEALPVDPCDQCNPAISQVAFTPANAGDTCDDGQFCTVGDTCDGAGICDGGPRDCSGAITECTMNAQCSEVTDQCVPLDPVPDGTVCNAADLCNAGSCSFGVCIPNTPVDCSAFDGPCTAGVCNPADGTCSANPLPDGTLCDDADVCTVMTSCSAGSCLGSPLDCDDNNDCTIDSCNSQIVGGCVNNGAANGTPCADDGLPCTTGTCQMASCAQSVNMGSCLVSNMCLLDGAADPNNICRVCDAETNQTMYSNEAAGVVCGGATCSGDGITEQTCDGVGGCQSLTTDCGAYTCDTNNNACFSSCLTTAECEAGAQCTSDGVTPGECVTDRPTASISGPVIADCGASVTLDGSGSTDPNNLALTYTWTQLAGPDVLTGVDTTMASLTFDTPNDLTMNTTFRFQLIVSNGAFDSDPAEWLVSVEACPTGMDDAGGSDMGNDMTGSDLGRDASSDASSDTGGEDASMDAATDQGGDTSLPEGTVKGSGCLCASTTPYPTDLSWIALLGLVFLRRRRRR